VAKGKGELNTYWLETTSNSRAGSSRSSDSATDSGNSIHDMEADDGDVGAQRVSIVKRAPKQLSGKTERLIDWNVDVLLRLLQQIVARRDVTFQPFDLDDTVKPKTTNPFDEVKEIIALPEYKERKQRDPSEVIIPEGVVAQLRDYVSQIAMLYNENPFHNFEHVRTVHLCKGATHLFDHLSLHANVLAVSHSFSFSGVARDHECDQVVVSYCRSIRRAGRLPRPRPKGSRVDAARSHVWNHV
jgi:hypothetical protein